MEPRIFIADLKEIESGIREKYIKVAQSPEGQFEYPTGRKSLEVLKYDIALIKKIPTKSLLLIVGSVSH